MVIWYRKTFISALQCTYASKTDVFGIPALLRYAHDSVGTCLDRCGSVQSCRSINLAQPIVASHDRPLCNVHQLNMHAVWATSIFHCRQTEHLLSAAQTMWDMQRALDFQAEHAHGLCTKDSLPCFIGKGAQDMQSSCSYTRLEGKRDIHQWGHLCWEI